MDNVFGVGGPELLLLLVLAVVFLGPVRMLKVARTLGRLVRDLRNYSQTLMAGLRQELASLDEADAVIPPPVPPPVPPPARGTSPTGSPEGEWQHGAIPHERGLGQNGEGAGAPVGGASDDPRPRTLGSP